MPETWAEGRRAERALLLGAPLLAIAFVLSIVLPLATYAVTLAVFGGPHVVSEMRYVDARFSKRFGRRILIALALLLVGVVTLRLGSVLGLWSGIARSELILVAGLAGVAIAIPGPSRAARLTALAGIGALGGLIAWAPLTTLVCLAVAHNLTPLLFVAERFRGAARRRALAIGALLFLGLPATIASGAVHAAIGGGWPDVSPLMGDGIASHLGAFIPGAWRTASWAVPLFGAVVFTQCLHYFYVIVLLPVVDGEASWWGADPGTRTSLLPWPTPGTLTPLLAGLGCLTLAAFALSFGEARAWYGLGGAVHAWLEVPVLLAAGLAASSPARA